MKDIVVISSVADVHAMLGLEKPRHPLISVIQQKDLKVSGDFQAKRFRFDLYQIWMKDGFDCAIGYGRNSYDFKEGALAFIKAGQVLSAENHTLNESAKGWLILFHPDLLRSFELGKSIHRYSFFDYEANEALHISDKEQQSLNEIAGKIDEELNQRIDKHSQKIFVSNIELLLDYSTRYYDRQFYTRASMNSDVSSRLEQFLQSYYEENEQLKTGVPSVKMSAEKLGMSAQYLSDLLRKETGLNAQETVQRFVIDRAKTLLLGTGEPVSQVAYQLGFEYPQHFSKLFKSKTGMNPGEYKNLN
jgi:AraC-like DNA-binding protein